MSEIALIKGPNRQENIKKSLEIIKKNIVKEIQALETTDYILIKPNLFSAKNYAAATSLESVEALLEFLRTFYPGKIIIGEGTSVGSTNEAFYNFHYQNLVDRFNIELRDLNHDDGIPVEAYDRNMKPIKVLVARTVAESPYTISISPIKTHNSVILSLSIENMVTGSLTKKNIQSKIKSYRNLLRHNFQDYKNMISQNCQSHNLSIASIFPAVAPNLAIIDGFTSIERNGPVGGQVVETDIALASTDAIAIDTLAAYITGFDPGKIGYLHYLDFSAHDIKAIGNKISECRKKLRPPDTLQDQLKWYNTKRN